MAKAKTVKKQAQAKSVPGKAKPKANPKVGPAAQSKVKAKAKTNPARAAKKPARAPKKAASKAVAPKKVVVAPKPAPKKVAARKAAPPSTKGSGDEGGVRLSAGSKAPSFELKDQSGNVVSSASLSGKPYVLYFYPKDDTPGCTREACGFRDSQAAFGKHGARVIGVSPDSAASHAKFAGKYGLPFTLLSDPDKVVAKAYGAFGKKQNYGREYWGIVRSTFVVDGSGKVKRAYYGVKVDGHVDSVLADVSA